MDWSAAGEVVVAGLSSARASLAGRRAQLTGARPDDLMVAHARRLQQTPAAPRHQAVDRSHGGTRLDLTQTMHPYTIPQHRQEQGQRRRRQPAHSESPLLPGKRATRVLTQEHRGTQRFSEVSPVSAQQGQALACEARWTVCAVPPSDRANAAAQPNNGNNNRRRSPKRRRQKLGGCYHRTTPAAPALHSLRPLPDRPTPPVRRVGGGRGRACMSRQQ